MKMEICLLNHQGLFFCISFLTKSWKGESGQREKCGNQKEHSAALPAYYQETTLIMDMKSSGTAGSSKPWVRAIFKL